MRDSQQDAVHPSWVTRTGVVLGISALSAGLAWGGIEGSKHDFSGQGWTKGDSCGVCHTPHREKPPSAAPLWDPNADLNRTFGTPLAESSKAGIGTTVCLRCHDGTVARDTIPVTRPRERFANKHHPGLFASGHGQSNHPVGISFPRVDRGFHSASKVESGGLVLLPGGRVECISCHDQHNMSGHKYMLRMSNARSALCLTCHNK